MTVTFSFPAKSITGDHHSNQIPIWLMNIWGCVVFGSIVSFDSYGPSYQTSLISCPPFDS